MKKISALLALAGLLLCCGCQNQPENLAKISGFTGKVSMKTSPNVSFSDAVLNSDLANGGAIRTGAEAEAQIETLKNKAKIKVFENSYYEVRAGSSLGFQNSGKAVFDVNKQETQIQVETAHGNTAVLGTKFGQLVATDTFELWVEEGLVEFTSKKGEKKKVAAGQKLQWKTSEVLPEPSQINVVESESFFGSNGSGFEFNKR